MKDYVAYSEASGQDAGPAILLLNSMGTSTAMWDPHMPLLESRFKVIRMDTRGHGQSAAPDGDYTFPQLVGDALDTLDRHGIEKAAVMGCSLGSMTALGLGLTAPDRIERIVCSAARADAPEPFRQTWDDRAKIIAEKGVAGLWEGALGAWFTPAFRAAHPEAVARMKTEFLKTSGDGYVRCGAALKQLDYLKDLPNLRVPTLFIAGSEDKGAPPAVMEQMAEATPDSLFKVIPDAAHIVNVNRPDAFSAAIAPFLDLNAP